MDKSGVTVKSRALRQIVAENPVFVRAMGLCPALAVSSTVLGGLTMGLAVTVILVLTDVVSFLLDKYLSDGAKFGVRVVAASGFACAVYMLLNAYMPDLGAALGIFVPLAAVSGLVFTWQRTNSLALTVLDGLFTGLGFSAVITVVSVFREIFGAGRFMGIQVPLPIGPASFFTSPAGAFVTLGLAAGVFKWVIRKLRLNSEKM